MSDSEIDSIIMDRIRPILHSQIEVVNKSHDNYNIGLLNGIVKVYNGITNPDSLLEELEPIYE